ncbi:methyltransferase [Pseudonocardia hispaniensis]|uniref:Methyltransferase n=1 Tax=Pseudonocardia hispaniensis TaxID=904933 RepID=A0ABW1J072_9PSEU
MSPGGTTVTDRQPDAAHRAGDRGRVVHLLFGFFPAQVIHAIAQLEVAEHLAAGPLPLDELARRTGTHPPSLYRLLRAAAALDLVRLEPGGLAALSPDGGLLRRAAPGSVGRLAMLFCGDQTWRSWGELAESVRTGQPAFDSITGRSAFAFLAEHPELAAVFTEAMAEVSRAAAPAVVASCDLSGIATLADLGGGNGTLLSEFLAATPGLRGILFDTAEGLGDADEVLAAAGVADRTEQVAGDFFTAVPPRCDGYLLKSVLHDWNDEDCLRILATTRAAMGPHATLFVVEPVVPTDREGLARAQVTLMSDLNMLVCTGGRERTEDEFSTLLAGAGLRLTDVTRCPPPTGYSVLRAVPA